MKESVRRGCIFVVFLLFFVILITPITAYTTEVTVTKLAEDDITIIDERTLSYQWMRANLPILGDGTTHYYHQGPVFFDDPDPIVEEQLRWNPEEDTNCYPEKDMGALRGTNLMDLCDLVGGMSPGDEVKVHSTDGWYKNFSHTNVYLYPERTGPMVLTWEKNSMYPDTGYTDGMRLVWFADTSVNPWGEHVFGNYDWHESAAPEYWYYYQNSGENYPTTTGISGQIVSDLIIFSKDPVPPPEADFLANTKTGLVQNGNFESGTTISPWYATGGVTRYTGSSVAYRHGVASAKLAATVGNPASIQQDVDLSDIGSIYFWRYTFGGSGKYLQVLVDDAVVANFTETSTVAGKYETVDISSYGFTGTHTLKFKATSEISGTFTVYLDDIEDFGPGTSGNAPLIVQFKDLSTKMQDTAHTSWAWDFDNDGDTDSTVQNPQYTYSIPGTYTVKLTATNAGGTDPETKTGYIVVTSTTPTIDVDATGNIGAWDLQPNADNEDSESIDLSVTTTAASWDVKVSDASANPNKGHMSQWVDGTGWTSLGKYLATKMQVKAKETDSYVAADSNSIILDQADGTGSYNIWLKQTTVPGDSALATGVYRVEITFTGSVN